MIISNIAAPLLGLVDTAIIGHLPQSIYLSAVALGATVVSFIYLLAIFLRMTTTAEIAHAFGADDLNKQRQATLHAIFLAVVMGLLVVLMRPLIIEFSWWLIEPDQRLTELATHYIDIRMIAAPAALINLVLLGVLLGRQQSRKAMLLVIFTNAVNVVGNLILVLGFDLNVVGVAWASVAAEISTTLVGLYFIRDCLPQRTQWRLQAQPLRHFIGMNSDVFVRSLLLQLCIAVMTVYAVQYGNIFVAANAVLMQFLMLISLGLDGIAYSVEALVGAARGRNDRSQERYWMRLTLIWSSIFAIGYALVFALAGDVILGLLTDLPQVLSTAKEYLPWLCLLPLAAHWSYYFDGVYVGLGWTRGMRNSMMFSAIAVFAPIVWLTQMYFSKENANHGLWLALFCFMMARGLSQWWLLLVNRKIIHHNHT